MSDQLNQMDPFRPHKVAQLIEAGLILHDSSLKVSIESPYFCSVALSSQNVYWYEKIPSLKSAGGHITIPISIEHVIGNCDDALRDIILFNLDLF